MKHLGDITKLNGAEIPFVDVITGGSPCQDLSIAGKRAGLAGERSGLFMEQIRVIKEMREASGTAYPRYMVWENVQGAFSSNKGKDFAAVLEETIRIVEPEAPCIEVPEKGWPTWGCYRDVDGRWSVAWRTLDAQYWGVPQRRRRIALVADFRGGSAPEILFERKGVSWDSETRGEARERTSERTERGTGETGASVNAGFRGISGEVAGTLLASYCKGHGATAGEEREVVYKADLECGFENRFDEPILLESSQNHATIHIDGICTTLPASMGLGGGYVPMIVQEKNVNKETNKSCLTPWDVQSRRIFDKDGIWPALYGGEGGGHGYVAGFLAGQGKGGIGYQEQVAPTMKAGSGSNGVPAICIQGNCVDRADTAGCNGKGWKEDVSYMLNTVDRHCVAVLPFDTTQITSPKNGNKPKYGDPCHPICAKAHAPAIAATMLFENHSQDCRYKGPLDVCPMLPAQLGTGGNNTPFVVQAYSFEKTYQDTAGTLSPGAHAGSYNGQDAYNDMLVARTLLAKANDSFRYDTDTYPIQEGFVRRLTPLECERLQGYPDGWTDIAEFTDKYGITHSMRGWLDENGKWRKEADSPRYKALGNSIALPPWRFVLSGIYKNLPNEATLGSLFDGIGGFPLIWKELGGVPVWASEIEPFPIAVTKMRFGDD